MSAQREWRVVDTLPPARSSTEIPPLVGRDAELDRLRDAWRHALDHRPRVVFLSGEPGIGKTRLAAEFAREAEREGGRVLLGRCDEDPVLPYEPFVEALRRSATTEGRGIEGALVEGEPVLLDALLPPSEGDAAHPGAGAWGDPATRRYVLFERVKSTLRAVAAERPLLLVLDDLQWADAGTVRLLRYLARGSWGAPALLLGCYRDTELEESQPLHSLIADLRSDGIVEHIALPPLSEADLRELAERRSGEPISAEDSRRLHEASGGNPLFAETLIDLVAVGDAEAGDGHTRIPPGGEGPLPAAARDVIGRRLSRLSAPCRELLARAAVLGGSVELAPLRTLWDGDEGALADGLAEAAGASLLVETDDAERARYRFVHALVREALYRGLPLPRRQQLHLRAARELAAAPGRSAERVANHYRLGGETAPPEEALPHALAAADAALAASAFDEAVDWWEWALELMERRGDDLPSRAQLLQRMGGVLNDAREQRRATDCLERALRLYEQTGDEQAIARAHSRVGWAHANGNLRTTNLVRARAHFAAAEPALATTAPNAALATLRLGQAMVGVSAMRVDELSHAEFVCRVAAELGRQDIEAQGRIWSGLLACHRGALTVGLRLLAEAWHTERTRVNGQFSAVVAWMISINEQRLGNPLESARWLRRELDDWPAPGAPAPWGIAPRLGSALADAGDLPAMRALRREHPTRDPERIEDAVEACAFAFFAGEWHSQVFVEAESLARGAVGRGDSCSRVNLDHWLIRAWRARGDASVAIAALENELLVAVEGGSIPQEAAPRADLAILYAEGGDFESAAGHLERLRAILANGEDWRGIEGKARLAEALLTAGEEGPDAAAPLFERALAVFRRYSTVWPEAEALEDWAGVLRTARRRAEASAKRRDAEAVYRRIGAGQPWLDRLERIAGGNGALRTGAALPDGLTVREAEVLRLVAAGRSNAEIASELVLSVRTVERHITTIYGKAGLSGRAAATAYAIRHRLIEE